MRLSRFFRMPVRQLQQWCDSSELSDWAAFFAIEDDPDDLRFARLGVRIAQMLGIKNVTAEQFLPPKHRVPVKQTDAQIKAGLLAWAKAHNRRVERRAAAQQKREAKRLAREAKKRAKHGD